MSMPWEEHWHSVYDLVMEGPFSIVSAVRTESSEYDERAAGRARMMAAAPELYRALESLLSYQLHGVAFEVVTAGFSALKKARGE